MFKKVRLGLSERVREVFLKRRMNEREIFYTKGYIRCRNLTLAKIIRFFPALAIALLVAGSWVPLNSVIKGMDPEVINMARFSSLRTSGVILLIFFYFRKDPVKQNRKVLAEGFKQYCRDRIMNSTGSKNNIPFFIGSLYFWQDKDKGGSYISYVEKTISDSGEIYSTVKEIQYHPKWFEEFIKISFSETGDKNINFFLPKEIH